MKGWYSLLPLDFVEGREALFCNPRGMKFSFQSTFLTCIFMECIVKEQWEAHRMFWKFQIISVSSVEVT